MTTSRNELIINLGPDSEETVSPPPPPPVQGLAEIIVTPVVSSPSETVDMEKERLRYIEEGKRQTLKRYEIQESKRAPRIQIDQSVVMVSWISAVAIAFITSAIVSFNGITAVAVFVGLSQSWMAYLFFFFIEIMYLLFLVAYLILSSRTDPNGKPERTRGAITGMVFFAGIAVLANAFHTFDYWEWTFTEPRAWAGMVLSIAAPIAIISISKMGSRVVFSQAVKV